MYDNDPNRMNRPPLGEPVDPPSTASMAIGGAIVALFIVLGIAFWPSGQPGQQTVTENTPRVESPTTPPANKPAPPAPTPPQ